MPGLVTLLIACCVTPCTAGTLAAMQGPRFENYVLSVLQMADCFAGQYARPTPAIYQLPTNHLPSIYPVSTK